jgi:hypothetical protein
VKVEVSLMGFHRTHPARMHGLGTLHGIYSFIFPFAFTFGEYEYIFNSHIELLWDPTMKKILVN